MIPNQSKLHFRTAFWMIPSSGKVPLKQFITYYFNQQSLYLRTTRLDTIVWPSNFYRARDFIFHFYYLNVYILRRAISTHSPLKYSMQFSWVHCTLQLFSMNRAIFLLFFVFVFSLLKRYLPNQHPCISGLQRGWIPSGMARQVMHSVLKSRFDILLWNAYF